MTADRRLRIGGWAALLVAILAPLRIVALWLTAGSPATGAGAAADPWTSQPYLAIEALRVVTVLVAIVGLDGFFRSHDAPAARTLLLVGSVGGGLGLVADIALMGGFRDGPIAQLLTLGGDVLIAVWFIGGSLILLRVGRQFARIGWTAGLGGLGLVLGAVAAAVGFGGAVGVTGTSLIDWFLLLGLFVVVYLVRIWRYVVGGRLPGPGIL